MPPANDSHQEDFNNTDLSNTIDSIALAHWHNPTWGGATYLVEKIAEALDLEEIYTIGEPKLKDSDTDLNWIDVTEGPVDAIRRKFGRAGEYALWEDVNWRQMGNPDVLITSGSTTRAVITPDDTLHINYCHSPPRWLYDLYHERKSSAIGQLARPALRYFRLRDQSVDPRVDKYLANSPIIQRRLWKYYKREATVLYPPLEIGSYYHDSYGDFYLYLGLLDREKGVPEIVEAFNSRKEQILFAGGRGDISNTLIDQINNAPNMEYLGFVNDSQKYELLATCRAVVFNAINEDFGIVPIEANASKKPCLVRDSGFPSLFIKEGYNGMIHNGTPESIRQTVEEFEAQNFEKTDFDSLIEPFKFPTFEKELRSFLIDSHEKFSQFSESFTRR